MERGFIKVWHKLKDSKCYSRGGVHRALLLTLFTEANWKAGHFRGEDILPGQWATSVLGLAQELGFPRTTVQRALADLVEDGVITVENMGNRWTRITLVNWATYQQQLERAGQPMGNPWATDGQPVGITKDIKNKDIKNTSYSMPESPDSDGCPQQKVLAVYREELPSLTQPRTWRSNDATALRARWNEKKKEGKFSTPEEGLDYFRKFFRYVARSPFLMGKVANRDGRAFQADIRWLIKAANFDKVLEGKYHE